MTASFDGTQEPSVWVDEISEEELQFLEQVMPEHLEAKALELEQDPIIASPVRSIGDRVHLKRAA
ncbi:MAG: hypothetical protein CBB79_07875 [Synechococcus sp. TMED19]|nr:MAG: hypothetical protein CBB79_10910 [Synechococcus sp. TMED19]OUT71491.1 MAG: hypothetical protein CBB79_07875 [Synechococcus sp. TMED19]